MCSVLSLLIGLRMGRRAFHLATHLRRHKGKGPKQISGTSTNDTFCELEKQHPLGQGLTKKNAPELIGNAAQYGGSLEPEKVYCVVVS